VQVLQVACGPLANGTSLPDAQRVVANLRELGHRVDVDDRLLAAAAGYFAALARAEDLPAGVLGLLQELRGREPVGHLVVLPDGPAPAGTTANAADAVLAGWYPEFSLPALEAACHAVWAGATLYSCSQSRFFATAGGRAMGTSRAISAMIKSVTGCRVHLVGKPSLAALGCAASRLGVPAHSVAVVGDDPDLEVPMAHRGRALAIAVCTGIGGAGSFDHLPAARGPHLTVGGVDELLAICQQDGR
jgi:ribonucleotide monophosphatase NagD (HAD superfamily)